MLRLKFNLNSSLGEIVVFNWYPNTNINTEWNTDTSDWNADTNINEWNTNTNEWNIDNDTDEWNTVTDTMNQYWEKFPLPIPIPADYQYPKNTHINTRRFLRILEVVYEYPKILTDFTNNRCFSIADT